MEKKYVVSGIVVLVVLVGGFLLIKKNRETTSMDPAINQPHDTGTGQTPGANDPTIATPQTTQDKIPTHTSAAVVVYTEQGFTPESVAVKKGETVTFKNKSGRPMWVGSNPHPTHTLYPEKSPSDCLGSSFDACRGVPAGSDWSFIFNSIGTWRYHDHLRADNQGTVVVQ